MFGLVFMLTQWPLYEYLPTVMLRNLLFLFAIFDYWYDTKLESSAIMNSN